MNSIYAKLSPAVTPSSVRTFVYRPMGVRTYSPQPAGNFFLQLVFANAKDGRDEEFNRWYDTTHAQDLLKVPGVVGVSRYVLSVVALGASEQPPRYLNMMSFRTPNVDQFGELLEETGKQRARTDAFDSTNAWRLLFEQAGPVITKGKLNP